jgi:PiT family inorganic phosphate transporter
MQLKDYIKIERAAQISNSEVGRLGTATILVVGAMLFTGAKFAHIEQSYLLIAGGDVVKAVKNGIMNPDELGNSQECVWAMMGALMGTTIWLNLATWLGAPVSTTSSIVGGVMGAGVAAAGWSIVNWASVTSIAMSWVISPVVGGIFAAGFLYSLKRRIFFKSDLIAEAVKVVRFMIAIMAWVFTTILPSKASSTLSLCRCVVVSVPWALVMGQLAALAALLIVGPMIRSKAPQLSADRDGVNKLFTAH